MTLLTHNFIAISCFLNVFTSLFVSLCFVAPKQCHGVCVCAIGVDVPPGEFLFPHTQFAFTLTRYCLSRSLWFWLCRKTLEECSNFDRVKKKEHIDIFFDNAVFQHSQIVRICARQRFLAIFAHAHFVLYINLLS